VPFDGVVTMAARLQGGNRPLVAGVTNLPDGTELMITLRRESSNYAGQDKTTVVNGEFQAGPFAQGDSGLNPGEYEIQVSSPLAMLQPASVRAEIGEKGDKLQGEFTKKAIDPFDDQRVVAFSTKAIVAGEQSSSLDAAARQQAESDLIQWWKESCESNRRIVAAVAARRGERFDDKDWLQKCLAENPSAN
jgi:hypothetical protein